MKPIKRSNPRTRIDACLRDIIRGLDAYHVADATGMLKMDAMENPFSWPGELQDQWLERLKGAELNRYPDPHAKALNQQIRETFKIPERFGILLGNGSDELIQIILIACAKYGASVMAPEPTFVMYKMIATYMNMQFHGVPLTEDFQIDVEQTLAAIERHRPAVIFLSYPNNPSGNLWDEKAVDKIIEAAYGLVIIDEAYLPFAQKTWLNRCQGHVMVMRTVSKLGLAGLRLGYLMADPEWITELDKVRLPYNINTLTQISAQFALEHNDVLEQHATTIREQREYLYTELNKIDGVTAYPSDANFILFRIDKADDVHARLRDNGILIKNLNKPGPLENCLRVTVGTAEENRKFLQALS